MQIFTKIFDRGLPFISYYSSYTPQRAIKNKLLLREAERISLSEEEMDCAVRTKKVYGHQFDYSQGYSQKEIFLSEHDAAMILGNSGAIVNTKGKVIAESSFDEVRLLKSPAFRLPAMLWPSSKKGTYTSIMHLPWANGNIFHWFIDCLPRLYSIHQIPFDGPIKLILQKDLKPYMKETLDFFLARDKRLQLVFLPPDRKWKLEKFWLPSFVSNHLSGYLPADYFQYVKNTVMDGYGVKAERGTRKIYISRAGAGRRKILNDDQLCAFLKSRSFEIILAEKLSYKEQVNLFASARFIVAGHGAGLTNVMFANKATVVEIQASDIVKTHYCLLSKAAGHHYYGFYTQPTLDANLNYQIDVAAFDHFLSTIDCDDSSK